MPEPTGEVILLGLMLFIVCCVWTAKGGEDFKAVVGIGSFTLGPIIAIYGVIVLSMPVIYGGFSAALVGGALFVFGIFVLSLSGSMRRLLLLVCLHRARLQDRAFVLTLLRASVAAVALVVAEKAASIIISSLPW